MSTETGTSLTVSRVIKADVDRVFEAWTQPHHLKVWSCPEGGEVLEAEVDLRVGGAFRLVMGMPKATHVAKGIYREIDAPRRLVYTWSWEEDPFDTGETLVTVEFNPSGDSTEVVMNHGLFLAPEGAKAHEEGWTSCLNRLEKVFV